MRYSKIVLAATCAAIFAIKTGTASALCFICDEIVELDAVRAACFLDDYEKHFEAIQSSEHNRQEISFAECIGEVINGSRGIIAFPIFPEGSDDLLKVNGLRLSYILDADSASCLKQLIENIDDPINPTARFNLVEDCPK